jgi:hypothetical protein
MLILNKSLSALYYRYSTYKQLNAGNCVQAGVVYVKIECEICLLCALPVFGWGDTCITFEELTEEELVAEIQPVCYLCNS